MAGNDAIKQKVYALVDDAKEEIVSLTSDMVRFPSTYLHEEDIQRYIEKQLKDMAADNVDFWYPDINEMKTHPAFCSSREDFNCSPIVVGSFKGSGGGRSIILNGHVDVVPEGTGWVHSPWSGVVEGDKLYGRGSGDMKAGIAAMLVALKSIHKAGIKLKGDVLVQTVVDEENGGMGTLATIQRGHKADAVIIPECTDMKIIETSIGSTWVRVTVRGKAAILANAHKGVNAIRKAMYIFDKLEEFEAKRTKELSHPMLTQFPMPFKINVGKLNAGIWPSSVPDIATMEIRYGISPNETVASAKRDFEAFIAEISAQDEWLKDNVPAIEWLGTCWAPGTVDAKEEIVQLTKRNSDAITGRDTEITGFACAADGGYYVNYLKIPFVLIGPGGLGEAHQVNEFVSIKDTVDTAKIIAATILDWCGVQ